MAKVTKKPPKGWGTVAQYAIERGCSRQSANRFVKKYEIKKNGKWVEFAAIDIGRGLETGEDGLPVLKTNSNQSARLTKLRGDILDTKSETDKLKFKALQGELLHQAAIATGINRAMQSIRKEMIDYPNNMAAQVAAITGGDRKQIQKVLTGGIDNVFSRLHELAKIADVDGTGNNMQPGE